MSWEFLDQFYNNINEATLKQIKLVDKRIDDIAKKKVSPIDFVSPELPDQLNRTREEVEYILDLIETGDESDTTLMDAFDLTDDQLNQLKAIVDVSGDWNEELAELIKKWKELANIEEITRISKDVSEIASSVSGLSTQFSELANVLDMPELAKFTKDLAFASEQIGILAEGLAASVASGKPHCSYRGWG